MTRFSIFNTALLTALLALACMAGGCGGGSATGSNAMPPVPAPPAAITGIAAPPQISVVTAKNAT